MMNVKSLNLDNRTGLSASRLNRDKQSCHDSGYCEPYGSKEESYWPQQWRALWPTQSVLDLTLLAFFSLSRSFVISNRAFKKNPHLQLCKASEDGRADPGYSYW